MSAALTFINTVALVLGMVWVLENADVNSSSDAFSPRVLFLAGLVLVNGLALSITTRTRAVGLGILIGGALGWFAGVGGVILWILRVTS
ncbi:hypothetical protein FXB39_05230 [Nocardioides sp. BGMRC 2183]|nr:hypothetical protein FXB39_05230 [Nocardioides sp. BGMRC 2183]